MTSLVADFLVNPVLRQARRFSFSLAPYDSAKPIETPGSSPRGVQARQDVGLSDAKAGPEAHTPLGNEIGRQTAPPYLPFRSSEQHPHTDVADTREGNSQPDDVPGYAESCLSYTEPQHEQISPASSDMSVPEASAVDHGIRPGQELSRPQLAQRQSSFLPEDDGKGALRRRIFAIQAQELGAPEKARLMHQLLMEGYTKSRIHSRAERPSPPSSDPSSDDSGSQTQQVGGPLDSMKFWQNVLSDTESGPQYALTDEDLEPTFAPVDSDIESDKGSMYAEDAKYRPLGCEHYRRNVKMQCSTCDRWYTCRFCHNQVEDHELVRKDTKNMLCMFCGTAQRAGESCVACGASAARYYCDICKLWNDDPEKPCYHCNDCGICRIGRGIGKDFFHCKKCGACIAISMEADHRCIERATDCDCPICGDYMFTSPKAVCFMKCGHSIHRECFQEHMQSSYKCPICKKSLANMESQFRNLELSIQSQPMPPEFSDTRAVVLCNDCSAKSSTPYHWLGLKCSVCSSYNTAQLQIIGLNAGALEANLATSNTGTAHTIDLAARDLRRRQSSNVRGAASADVDMEPPLHGSATTDDYSDNDDNEDDDDRDILGFWSRVPRSIASNEEGHYDGEPDSTDDESVTTSDEEAERDADDDGEDSDSDDFDLLGHR
ncbi:hypothetical protein GGR56DRAFT_613007 [Xylariaceae sp. FL0804]|nr:hypothetical protein GGR56DRAFT_613007 [Xylariaceae sp. FL0804]